MANWPLEDLIWRENVAEILEAMTPEQLVVVALRLEGLDNRQIARLLGITRTAVYYRFFHAQERIARKVPEVRDWLGQGLRPGPRPQEEARALEMGYLCREAIDENEARAAIQF